MSLKNLLDLRKRVSPQIQIVERIIFKERSWKKEVFRTLLIALVATGAIWGISKADNIASIARAESKSFSAIGTVSGITGSTLSLSDARGSDDKSKADYAIDISSVDKIETRSYAPLTVNDISIGDRIIVQGAIDGDIYVAKRIISFAAISAKEIPVATTTPAVTESASSTSSTTPSSAPSATGGSSDTTSTTTASTTPETDTASSSTDTATTTTATSTGIIETIKDAVSTVIDTVTNFITGSSTEGTTTTETPAPAPAPAPEATGTTPAAPSTDTPPTPAPAESAPVTSDAPAQ